MSEKKYRLNQYIAKSGVCSRRKADLLIQLKRINVNGSLITKLGYKVSENDIVELDGKKLIIQSFQYIVLNKPKGYITTVKDEKGRKTVMDLISHNLNKRMFPVGRLDKNTTGVLLLTNDGDLSQKLIHPKNKVEKMYHVFLNKKMKESDYNKIKKGFALDDGFIQVDKINVVNNSDQKELVLSLHSGRNRIVRRIFEFFTYKVIKLDRILFAGISKKKILRGKYRHLSKKEIGFLKMK
ncbi:MAG: pseudouridine synthase [Flavobacteriales bacterium]|nr:pseudouridine synthase [Flavobacteriales bacterium]|tara:strand:- start:83547 stop:84263 length:717 start_codon:yes stop_codon:yes gene_type:complete